MPRCTAYDIVRATAEVTGRAFTEIIGEGRGSDIVPARFLAAYVCCRAGHSRCATGRAMNRDHSSILHAYRTVEGSGTPFGDLEDIVAEILMKAEDRTALSRRRLVSQVTADMLLQANDNVEKRKPEQSLAPKQPEDKWMEAARVSTQRFLDAMRDAHSDKECVELLTGGMT